MLAPDKTICAFQIGRSQACQSKFRSYAKKEKMSDLSTAVETEEIAKQDSKASSEVPSLSSPSIKTNDKEIKSAGDNLSVAIPPELAYRHPLQNRWALWYLKGDRAKNWEECLKRVSVFDSVEDFWALYNHIQPASGLTWGSDYYLFKEGIKPMWEDPQNIEGGRWLMVIEKNKRTQKLDTYWLELLMAIVGEQFDELGDHICGAVVNVRKVGDKVALWTRDSTQDDVNLRIGHIIKDKLEILDSEQIKYEVHKELSARVGSNVKPKLIILEKSHA
uniref:eIF-4F 25 kDa subunit n=1 Tax=Ditylenchus dipsaci TaxID=166011 RepID=A0A915DZY1_9BILA